MEEIAKGVTLPNGAELLQVVPKLSAIAKVKGLKDPYGDDYGKCLEMVLSKINVSRGFLSNDYPGIDCKGELTRDHIRLLASSKAVLMKLGEETPGDFIIIPINVNMPHKGSTVCRSRRGIEHSENQWALPSWVVGHHLLTHSRRLRSSNDFSIDCAGDEYSPSADGEFTDYLCFYFYDGREFYFDRVGLVSRSWGAVLGWVVA